MYEGVLLFSTYICFSYGDSLYTPRMGREDGTMPPSKPRRRPCSARSSGSPAARPAGRHPPPPSRWCEPCDHKQAVKEGERELHYHTPWGIALSLYIFEHLIGENIRRYPMFPTILEHQLTKLVNSDACPTPHDSAWTHASRAPSDIQLWTSVEPRQDWISLLSQSKNHIK
jgi:hypothetical protein